MPKLVVVEPEMESMPLVFELRERELSIGREKDNTVSLDREAISGYHVELVWKDGDYQFSDLNSTNGTYYNGEQVKEGVLRNGDILQVADVVFRYESEVDPSNMEKLMKAEESSRKEKAWKIRKNMQARKTSSIKTLELAPDEVVVSDLATPVVETPEAVKISVWPTLLWFVAAFALGGLSFFVMNSLM
ncbi:MAG: FHA domain-containing protein [Verrucomicrobiota bacterium]